MIGPQRFERTPAYRLAKRTTPKRLARDARVDREWAHDWEWRWKRGPDGKTRAERFQEFMEPLLDKHLLAHLRECSVELRLFDIVRR